SPYAITPSAPQGTGLSNYAISFANGNLTVTPKALTLTADDQVMVLGGAVPTLTATPGGFVNGDTAAVVGGKPTLTPPFTPSSPPGMYPIRGVEAGPLTAANYVSPAANFANGTLTVNAPPTVLTSPASPAPILLGQSAQFTSTASDGFPTPTAVQWQIDTGNG